MTITPPPGSNNSGGGGERGGYTPTPPTRATAEEIKVLTDAVTAANTLHNGAAEGTEPGEYAEGSKATLQTAIEAANAIATKENVTKAEVDKGIADLQTAVDAFKAGKVPTPTPATAEEIKVLTDAVASANTLHNGAAEGTEPGQYAEGSKVTLQTGIEQANAIATKENVTKAEVDKGIADLQKAVDAFKAGKVPAPTPATAEEIKVLTDAVASANTLHDGATEGTEPGEYAEGSKATLQTAIEAANAIATKENVTKAEVDKGIADLQTAVDAFKAGKVPAPTPATAEEITVLTDAVTAANTLHNGAAEGTEPGQYAEGSKETLKTVIDAADAVATKENVTKAEVDKGIADLQTAVDAFKAGKVPAPTPATAEEIKVLTDAVTAANTLHNGAAEGTEPGEYAEGSKATLQTAIEAADAVATKENVTKAEVDKGIADLQTAVNAFKAGKVPAPTPATAEEIKVLTDAVASANTLHDGATEGTEPGEYAEGSKATLQTAIEAANAIATKENVTKAEVDKGIADLQTAVDAFKAGKVPGQANTSHSRRNKSINRCGSISKYFA